MTKEAITPDGWLKTGDVGQMMPITNAIKIIDTEKIFSSFNRANTSLLTR